MSEDSVTYESWEYVAIRYLRDPSMFSQWVLLDWLFMGQIKNPEVGRQ